MPGQETIIKNQILDYLKYKNYFAWLTNTAGNFNKFSNSFYKNPRLLRGVVDILCLHKGKFIAIEVKAGKGKQSEWQREYQAEVERNGGTYLLVYSLDDLIDALK